MHLKKCINKLPEETRIGEYYTLLLVLRKFLLNPEFFSLQFFIQLPSYVPSKENKECHTDCAFLLEVVLLRDDNGQRCPHRSM